MRTVKEWEEREKLWLEYVQLLGDALESSAAFLHVHGQRYGSKDIERGRELRASLGIQHKSEK